MRKFSGSQINDIDFFLVHDIIPKFTLHNTFVYLTGDVNN